MSVFIQSIAAITVPPFDGLTPYIRADDPNFKELLNPLESRRMSRIIKRAVVTSQIAIADSKIELPDAIISGTGLGCIEDTEKFLDTMVNNHEQGLQPSNFIQSTHNTISSQIAIRIGCNNYNNTHTQKSISFESALFEALLLFGRGRIHNALIGGHDEMTPAYFNLLKKTGHFDGVVATEGSVAMIVSDKRNSQSMAELKAMSICYQPSDLAQTLLDFLTQNNTSIDDIDLILTGGDIPNLLPDLRYNTKLVNFETLTGRYFTAGAFAIKIAVDYIVSERAKQILIYNHSDHKNHTFVLLCGN